ncbi:hypothetical protein EOD23_33750, partial [Mesorhizobium sp. USDA-HM6]
MKILGNKKAVMPVAIAAVLAFGQQPAGAQGLFDMLFGGGIRHNPQGEFPPPPKPRKMQPGTGGGGGVRISSPTYNTYKADKLVRVDFKSLLPVPQPATAQDAAYVPTLTSTAFRDAVAGLGDYELFAEPDIAKALVAYYSANPDFIWVTGDAPNSRAQDAVRVLGEAASYGLTPADYSVDVPVAT